jgi:hypothetical protein
MVCFHDHPANIPHDACLGRVSRVAEEVVECASDGARFAQSGNLAGRRAQKSIGTPTTPRLLGANQPKRGADFLARHTTAVRTFGHRKADVFNACKRRADFLMQDPQDFCAERVSRSQFESHGR